MTSHATPDLDYFYDREPDPRLVDLFRDGQPLSIIRRYAIESAYPTDLFFWADRRAGLHRASLYCGLIRMLDVHWRRSQGREQVRLETTRTQKKSPAFDQDWEKWVAVADLPPVSRGLSLFLDHAIPESSLARGALGAAALSNPGRTVVAREFVGQFRDEPTRRKLIADFTTDIVNALHDRPLAATLPSFKIESDALVVDHDGRLVVTEIESRRGSEVPFTVAQAVIYERFLKMWLREDSDAVERIQRMVDLRTSLGLGPRPGAGPEKSPDASPPSAEPGSLVLIQCGASDRLLENLLSVRNLLIDRGIAEAEFVKVREVNLLGDEFAVI